MILLGILILMLVGFPIMTLGFMVMKAIVELAFFTVKALVIWVWELVVKPMVMFVVSKLTFY